MNIKILLAYVFVCSLVLTSQASSNVNDQKPVFSVILAVGMDSPTDKSALSRLVSSSPSEEKDSEESDFPKTGGHCYSPPPTSPLGSILAALLLLFGVR
ncbi:hypothetical protein BAnh1_11170 [Bartonella australis AUST/NH1]|uniref:Hemin binding protein n=1 Tax=Bartonella australis (strain Aust/NH1) TaxID=1094489 RepID=M1P581_BARAA|nr:hypothetical protein [Bartonella australis]AGF74985.1 hypothetical protein BAnh1_11170 [Bartonella australis AUST/NH1]